jgi:hypothetical protein
MLLVIILHVWFSYQSGKIIRIDFPPKEALAIGWGFRHRSACESWGRDYAMPGKIWFRCTGR